ncbi:SRPBCC family protein [Allostreptomyces psammosilenae]|uniref:Uncharacterized protein n=1 Tax=Allostreptomyces psammosilenae TaxID=1892865 RepID=A0A852ZR01_9ACTN|nr:SRPBCC family protein [Allostreptomyces psammosilenae]NYI04876.1 hypothetical protein [Allostreptomyces psammosilenae]
MAEFESARTLPGSPEIAFHLLQEAPRTGGWLPLRMAFDPLPDGGLRLTGRVLDREVDRELLYRAEPGQRRLEWTVAGADSCTGWFQVADSASGTSEVTAHLSVLGEWEERLDPRDAERLRGLLDETVGALEAEVRARADLAQG